MVVKQKIHFASNVVLCRTNMQKRWKVLQNSQDYFRQKILKKYVFLRFWYTPLLLNDCVYRFNLLCLQLFIKSIIFNLQWWVMWFILTCRQTARQLWGSTPETPLQSQETKHYMWPIMNTNVLFWNTKEFMFSNVQENRVLIVDTEVVILVVVIFHRNHPRCPWHCLYPDPSTTSIVSTFWVLLMLSFQSMSWTNILFVFRFMICAS